MTITGIQPCTVCGAAANSQLIFEKESDGRGDGVIALYRCGSCNTAYLGRYNRAYEDDLYAYYQQDKGKPKEEIYDPLTRNSYMQVLRLIARYGDGKAILDVGCGRGDFVDAALSEGFDVEGIELSQPAVDIAQGYHLPVAKLDFFSSQILDSSRDVVTMFEVIEHLPDPVSFLQRAEAVVRPGGLVYLTTPNFNSLDRRVLGAEWEAIHREHLTFFTPATLVSTISNNTTLQILHIETRNVSPGLIRRATNVGRRLPPDEGQMSANSAGPSPAPDLRAAIGKSPWLSLLKRGANSLLNATSLGSTIVTLLRRSGGPNAKY